MSRFRIVPVSIATLAIAGLTLACSVGAPKATPVPTSGAPTAPATQAVAATDVVLTPQTAAASETPAAAATQDFPKGVVIMEKSAYTDSYNYYHVIGQVLNNTEAAITNIELLVSVADAKGTTLLKDSDDQPVDTLNFSPMLYTLAPGESSPFDYYFHVDDGTEAPSTFDVSLSGQDSAETTRGKFDVQNTALFADSNGTLHYSGELINLSDQPIKLDSVAGAAFDENNALLSANSISAYSEYLAPAGDAAGLDRTPFMVDMDNPATAVASARLFIDSSVDSSSTVPDVQVAVSNAYVDDFESYHLVGTVTNNGSDGLTANIVAGLYAADKTVIDASASGVYLYLAPGESVPFDFNSFRTVDFNTDQASKVASYTVQIDPYWTFATSSNFVALKSSGDAQKDNGNGSVTVTGTITNSTGKALSSESVMVTATDAQGKLVAVGTASIYPEGDAIEVGHKDTYSADIDLPTDTDVSTLTFATLAQGIVK